MFQSRLVRIIVAAGVLIPWVVGISIKVYLDSHGEPTWSWLYFLHPARLIAIVWATFWLGLPSLVLGYFTHLMYTGRIPGVHLFTRNEKGLIVIASAVWGAAGSVFVFIDMFWEFHPVSLMAPFFYTVLYLDDYLYGLAAGSLLALISRGIRQRKRKHKIGLK